jgi:hypothetical protein
MDNGDQMTSRNENAPAPSDTDAISRRRFLMASAGVGASALAGRALADTLADVQVGSRAMNEDLSFVTAGNYGARNYGSKSVSAE